VSVSAGGAAASDPGAGGDGASNPITVVPGKGWLITLPVPREVLAKLGGPGQLAERMRPIMDTRPGHHGELTPAASDKLAAAYDALFEQLKALPASRPEAADPANPISVDPGKGWSVTLPVPKQVLGRLGGASHLKERLRPIVDALPGPGGELTPDASDQLAAVYGEVLHHLEVAVSQKGQRPGQKGQPPGQNGQPSSPEEQPSSPEGQPGSPGGQ
jgi:hypothetical protein